MRDVMLRNPATVTGATLVAGNLTDGNQAVTLSGSGTFVVPDSVSSSLAVADGVAGGMAMVGWFKVAALPSSTQTILGKAGSYELKLTAAGKLTWTLTGATTATVTSNTSIATNRWYMVAGVYNGDYSGVPQLGQTTAGATLIGLAGDYRAGALTGNNNLQVSQFLAQENGHVSELVMRLAIDSGAPYSQDVAAVIYRDTAGAPGEKLAQSDGQFLVSTSLGGPIPLSNVGSVWWTFPLEASLYRGSNYWLGFAGGALHTSDTTVLVIGATTTGGQLRGKNSVVSEDGDGPASQSVDDPFGTPALTNTTKLDVYANYTPTSRTGNEGQAVLYVDGVLDNSVSYTSGIADSTNNLQHPTTLAVTLDDWMIFNRRLTAEEVAMLYASR